MRALPDMDAKLTAKEQQELRQQAMVMMLNAKADWMDGIMRKVLPPDLYRLAFITGGTPSQQEHRKELINNYLRSQDIVLQETGMNARFVKGRRNGKPEQIGPMFVVKLAEE